MENIYLSLDEAREELKKRWNNVELRKKIEKELGDKFMPKFSVAPRGVSFKQIFPAENGSNFFYQCAKYVGSEPLVIEYHDDIFTHLNEEKKGYGRLRVISDDNFKGTVDIMDFHAAEKKPLGDIKIKTGERLVDFHHNLLKMSGYDVEIFENSKWFHSIGKAKDYYYYFLLHFVAHGVLFETFSLDEREKGEKDFVDSIICKNVERISKKFGLKPIVVRSYPENQTDEEDFYWWCYPLNINNYILDYAKKNKLAFKRINKF